MATATEFAPHIRDASGTVVCLAAEGLWGLSCRANCAQALTRILHIKNRPDSKGLIVLFNSYQQLKRLIPETQDLYQELNLALNQDQAIEPTTFLVRKPDHEYWQNTISQLCGDSNMLAVRVTQHQPVHDLITQCQHPLVSTSANIHGQQPATTREQLDPKITEKVDAIIDGETDPKYRGRASAIINAATGEKLR